MKELYNDPEYGRNLTDEELEANRNHNAKYYVPENRINACGKDSCNLEHEIIHDKYRLVISHYKTEPGRGGLSKGEVFCGDKLIATVKRNYDDFWHYFVLNHPKTGHDYLLCGEDYQGYNVINLTTGENRVYIARAALDGIGWCIIQAMNFDAETCKLTMDGCIWACPFETITFDFSNPDVLPLPILDVKELD